MSAAVAWRFKPLPMADEPWQVTRHRPTAEQFSTLESLYSAGQVDKLLDALYEAREFIAGYVDVVDGPDGEPQANRAMSVTQEIDAAIEAAGGRPG